MIIISIQMTTRHGLLETMIVSMVIVMMSEDGDDDDDDENLLNA